MAAYFAEFGVILLPICLLQVWISNKAFTKLPVSTLAYGLCGGIGAIFCELMPVSLRGTLANFQTVPIILAILYGNRRAGWLAAGLLVGFFEVDRHITPVFLLGNSAALPLFAISLTIAIPMLCHDVFERSNRRTRGLIVLGLCIEVAMVKLALPIVVSPAVGIQDITHHASFDGLASLVKLVIAGLAYLLLESIRDAGAARTQALLDRAERERSDAALTRTQRLHELGQVAAGVVHDIRNPLQTMMALVEVVPASPGAEPYLQMMREEVARINLLLNELLSIGHPKPDDQITGDLSVHVQHVLRLLDRNIRAGRLTVTTTMDAEHAVVACSPNHLRQVLFNILQNAVEASHAGATIDVQVGRERQGWMSIRVADHGEGMPSEMIARVGEPFITTKESGTGLGLMVTKRIVEDCHGTLRLQSEPGQGTVVTIALPAAGAAHESAV